MSEQVQGQDFIVSELISELKAENVRKDGQIRQLTKDLRRSYISGLLAVLIAIGICYLYMYQYDYTSTETVTQTAEGVYALIDSEGNVVGQDMSPEEIQSLMEEVVNGDSESDPTDHPYENS